jgi:hypothetical protein
MSLFAILMIAGWVGAIAMIGGFALSESGKLLTIRQRIAAWWETSTAPVADESGDRVEAADEDAA